MSSSIQDMIKIQRYWGYIYLKNINLKPITTELTTKEQKLCFSTASKFSKTRTFFLGLWSSPLEVQQPKIKEYDLIFET